MVGETQRMVHVLFEFLVEFSSFPDNLGFTWNLSGRIWLPACLELGPMEINDMENEER